MEILGDELYHVDEVTGDVCMDKLYEYNISNVEVG